MTHNFLKRFFRRGYHQVAHRLILSHPQTDIKEREVPLVNAYPRAV